MFQEMIEEIELMYLEQERVRIYMNLPEIPYGQTVTIKSIGATNYNPLSKQSK